LAKYTKKQKEAYAAQLRANPTASERLCWELLRDGQTGAVFKPQQIVCGWIVDFLCEEKKLVIELDGVPHGTKEAQAVDDRRDAAMQKRGYRVFRIPSSLFFREPLGLLQIVFRGMVDDPDGVLDPSECPLSMRYWAKRYADLTGAFYMASSRLLALSLLADECSCIEPLRPADADDFSEFSLCDSLVRKTIGAVDGELIAALSEDEHAGVTAAKELVDVMLRHGEEECQGSAT